MRHTITWVATFNGASARFYLWDRTTDHLSLLDLSLPAGAHRAEFRDRPVRTYSSASFARGAGDPETDSERALEDDFVRRVADILSTQHANAAFHHLVVAAPPRALGAFRLVASDPLTKALRTEIAHDYVNTPMGALRARLSEHVVP